MNGSLSLSKVFVEEKTLPLLAAWNAACGITNYPVPVLHEIIGNAGYDYLEAEMGDEEEALAFLAICNRIFVHHGIENHRYMDSSQLGIFAVIKCRHA